MFDRERTAVLHPAHLYSWDDGRSNRAYNSSQQLKDWLVESFHPLLAKLTLECVSWEDLLAQVVGSPDGVHAGLSEFYQRCLRYNRSVNSR